MMGHGDVLLIVDVQNDFCPGGALAVSGGNQVIEPINRLMQVFQHAIATQDWHPLDHESFASAHPGRHPFETIETCYGQQTLWPDHCVQGTRGAELHPSLLCQPIQSIIRKGFRKAVDSYSAFFENDRVTPTGLAGYLRERSIRRIVCVGLALDFCVRFSAEDACRAGFEVLVVPEACRAIDVDGSLQEAWKSFERSGIGAARICDLLA